MTMAVGEGRLVTGAAVVVVTTLGVGGVTGSHFSVTGTFSNSQTPFNLKRSLCREDKPLSREGGKWGPRRTKGHIFGTTKTSTFTTTAKLRCVSVGLDDVLRLLGIVRHT